MHSIRKVNSDPIDGSSCAGQVSVQAGDLLACFCRGAFQHIVKLKVFDNRLLYTTNRLTFFKNEQSIATLLRNSFWDSKMGMCQKQGVGC